MDVHATAKYLPISPQKVRLVCDLVRGMDVYQASEVLQHMPQKGAGLLLKVLESALANAENNFGLEPEDRVSLEEFRAYVLMMDARGRAYQALEEGEPASALAHVNRGILAIKTHLESFGQIEAVDRNEELKILRALSQDLNNQVPHDSLIVTRRALRDAIEQERFEEAARLRDTLRGYYKHEL